MIKYTGFSESIDTLARDVADGTLGIVVIPSTKNPYGGTQVLSYLIGQLNERFPDSVSYTYIPPAELGSISSVKRVLQTNNRSEQIPSIIDPNMPYVIVDDVFYSGDTIRKAAERLIEQNVSDRSMWFLVAKMIGFDSVDEPVLDRYEKIKK